MVQTFTVKLPKMEVRKIEEVELEIGENTYRSLNIHFDTEDGDRLVFKDKNVENKDKYQRGTIGTLELTISIDNITKTSKTGIPYITEKTTITIKNFTEDKKRS